MPYKNPEAYNKYMRNYMRERRDHKKQEQFTSDHLKTRTISRFHRLMMESRTDAGKQTIEKLIKNPPQAIPPLVKEVAEEVAQLFPEESVKYRELIEGIASREFDSYMNHSDEVSKIADTMSAHHRFVLDETKRMEKQVSEASERLMDLTRGRPEKTRLYPHQQTKLWIEYMKALRELGYGFCASREACGERFVESRLFWSPEWMRDHPAVVFGRSRYEMGSRFRNYASQLQVNTQFLAEWMAEELEEIENFDSVSYFWSAGPYRTIEDLDAFEYAVNPLLDKDLSFNKILDYLRKTGKLDILNIVRRTTPDFLRHHYETLRSRHHQFLVMDVDTTLIEGIKALKPDAEIIKDVRTKFDVYTEELKNRLFEIRLFMDEHPDTRKDAAHFQALYRETFLTDPQRNKPLHIKIKNVEKVKVTIKPNRKP